MDTEQLNKMFCSKLFKKVILSVFDQKKWFNLFVGNWYIKATKKKKLYIYTCWGLFLVLNLLWTSSDDDWQEEHKRLAELDEKDGLGGGQPLEGAAMGADAGLGGAGSSSARLVPSSSVHLPPQSTIPPIKFSSSSLGLPPTGTRCFYHLYRFQKLVLSFWSSNLVDPRHEAWTVLCRFTLYYTSPKPSHSSFTLWTADVSSPNNLAQREINITTRYIYWSQLKISFQMWTIKEGRVTWRNPWPDSSWRRTQPSLGWVLPSDPTVCLLHMGSIGPECLLRHPPSLITPSTSCLLDLPPLVRRSADTPSGQREH